MSLCFYHEAPDDANTEHRGANGALGPDNQECAELPASAPRVLPDAVYVRESGGSVRRVTVTERAILESRQRRRRAKGGAI
jgi:hypothetical protein